MGQPILTWPSTLGPANRIDVRTLVMCSYLLSQAGANIHSTEQMSIPAMETKLYLNWMGTDCCAL